MASYSQVARAVSQAELRPTLPKRWPEELRTLLGECWAQEPVSRPEFAQLLPRLETLLTEAKSKTHTAPNELLDALEFRRFSGCCTLM